MNGIIEWGNESVRLQGRGTPKGAPSRSVGPWQQRSRNEVRLSRMIYNLVDAEGFCDQRLHRNSKVEVSICLH